MNKMPHSRPIEFEAIKNLWRFEFCQKNDGKICDVLIFTEKFAKFGYLRRFDVHVKMCDVKTQTNI